MTAIAVQNGADTFGSRRVVVRLLSQVNGRKTQLENRSWSDPCLFTRCNDGYHLCATKNGYISALSTDTGKVQWEWIRGFLPET